MTRVPGKIVVVDDDRTQLTALTLTLERQGYRVVPVQDPEEVLATLAREEPDLLLLDILMPKVDGLDLLRRIKADDRWRDMPILMISVLAPEDAAVTSLGLGASDFVAKPFRAKELAARVEAQLRASQLLRQARLDARHAVIEATVRSEMLDILHEVTEQLAPEEIYRVLASRVRHALRISRCSIVLTSPGDDRAVVVVAADDPNLSNLEIRLADYPEIRRAIELQRPVLVRDVQSDPLFTDMRAEWQERGVCIATHSAIAVPFTMAGTQSGVFFLRTFAGDAPLDDEDLAFAEKVIETCVGVIDKAYQLEDARFAKERYEWLATTDPLTGCFNRRALLDRLEMEHDRVRRYGLAVGVLMVDLDHFKRVNDTRGHLAGDTVLRKVGALLRSELRSVDTVARFGGDEFVMLLPETPLAGARTLADRIRERIADTDFADEGPEIRLTASVGVTMISADEDDEPEAILRRVDAILYTAKDEGRNVVRT
jgi:two-component system cell cycle response regulator